MIDTLNPNFNLHPGSGTAKRVYALDHTSKHEVDVTIVTPYYNTSIIFEETYNSVIRQSFQNWEWIIVDDGSPDTAAVERLAAIAKRDSRIRVVRQLNGGTAKARNTGFAHSNGRFICLLDHDDMLEVTYLEKASWFLDSNTEFSFCNSYSVVFGEQNFLWTTGFERGKQFLQANSGPPISVVRRSAYEQCGGFDETIRVLYEDWDFWLAMAKSGNWGYTIQEYLQWYRKLGAGRYEQILLSGYENTTFAKEMQLKYRDLDKVFPEPAKKFPAPFEDVMLNSNLSNPLRNSAQTQRTLFLLPWMVTGGADRVNLDLIEGLQSNHHEVTVCATLAADHKWMHEFAKLTPDIFVLPNFLRAVDFPRFLIYLIESRSITTVIVSGSTLGYQLVPLLRAVTKNVAFLDLSHVEEPAWLNGGHPRFGAGYQDTLDLNVVTTGHLATWMQTRGADPSRVKTLYTGVRLPNTPRLASEKVAVRDKLGLVDGVTTIVFSGRLTAQKRPLLAISILSNLVKVNLPFRALIIGDGDLSGKMKHLIAKENLDSSVQMLGSIDHATWLQLLDVCDILLMPSEYEGISLALLEAMAAGVVPVVANVGGHKEVVSSSQGYLINHSDSEISEYVTSIGHLIQDKGLLKSMSANCGTAIRTKFSWRSMIEKFLYFIDEAHEFRRSAPRNPVGLGFGRELAVQALEYKRLTETVDWLWQFKQQGSAPLQSSSASGLIKRSLVRTVIAIGQTELGRRLVKNDTLRAISKKLLGRLFPAR
jgi:glycosyltransferase involved in cell wall biosynthesis